MDGLTVSWTKTAKRQRDRTFSYWNTRNGNTSYSKKLNLAIRERTNLLKSNFEMGRATEYDGTKAIFMGHYTILYKIKQPKIFIVAFWDNRRDPAKLVKYLGRK
jgi:toxin YoeB